MKCENTAHHGQTKAVCRGSQVAGDAKGRGRVDSQIEESRQMQASETLATGGTGSLGRLVVARLRDAGRDVRGLGRRQRPGTIPGDLLTGEGWSKPWKAPGYPGSSRRAA